MLAPMIAGRATPEATHAYHAEHAARAVADHARRFRELALSSVGIGTYLGPADDPTDARYDAALARALARGINVIDTASTYRGGRSERVIGRVLAAGQVPRDRLVVSSKAGFLGSTARAIVEAGLAGEAEIVAGCHCLTPRFLRAQLAASRAQLQLSTIDIYYLHNPEMQLDEVDRSTFRDRMRAAFEVLEAAVDAGQIQWYGTATWTGYREPGQLDLAELVALAKDVAGERHRFAFVQLPLNPRMTEAATATTQRGRTLLAAARDHGCYVMSSASILQGKLEPRAALAWTRAQPGLGTALVGTSRVEHVDANAAVFTSSRPAAP